MTMETFNELFRLMEEAKISSDLTGKILDAACLLISERRLSLDELNQKHAYFGTPLYYACELGFSRIVAVLLQAGVGIDRVSNNGFTGLHNAAEHGHAEIVNVLLDNGADPNAASDVGYTPLMLAAEFGRFPVVEVLLARGGNPLLKGRAGFRAYNLVGNCGGGKENGDKIKKLLKKYERVWVKKAG